MRKTRATRSVVNKPVRTTKPVRMTKVELFEHIDWEQAAFIAEKANCHTEYVWKILKGKRAVNSALARKIVRAARYLNRSIENARKKTNEIITDND